jgi:glycosyltransferase involved in cell wall biosynthesis
MQLPEDRVTVIPQGNAVIAPQGLPPLDPLKLLYLGFIRHGKGLEDLIEALAQALQNQPSLRQRLRLTIAGRISPEIPFGGGDSYLSRLKAHVVARGIVDMVSFKTDIATDAIPQLIHAHHVMVLPYREPKNLTWIGQMRGTSSALSWAAACGRGAITSDARDFPEEVAQGNGAVFAQGDVTALAGIFVQLAKRPQQVADWAAAATTVGKRREWPQIAEQFSQIFSAAIQRVR